MPLFVKRIAARIFGSRTEKHFAQQARLTMPSIEILTNNWNVSFERDDDDPIFVFSSSWRSGSTLLQRLICSDNNILLWGEPYHHCQTIPRLSESLRAFNPSWPDKLYIASNNIEPESQWIANLFPSPQNLASSHKALLDLLLKNPARDRGYNRRGLKEVRLDGDHAIYLRFLYPNAKFIFLIRSVYDAFNSYKGRACFCA